MSGNWPEYKNVRKLTKVQNFQKKWKENKDVRIWPDIQNVRKLVRVKNLRKLTKVKSVRKCLSRFLSNFLTFLSNCIIQSKISIYHLEKKFMDIHDKEILMYNSREF